MAEAQTADQARAHGLSEARVLEDVILERQAVKRLLEPTEVRTSSRSCSGRAVEASRARPSSWISAGRRAEIQYGRTRRPTTAASGRFQSAKATS